MPRQLTSDEAEKVIEDMKLNLGRAVLEKYKERGYSSFGQLEKECIRVTGKSWKEYSKDELETMKKEAEATEEFGFF
ncbi:hypothetical protein HZA33_02390 [Candidatus Pacearchaeota archaeon]|nr:hypothetical protein [Candidatus Pacearchaeota archaeon]